jgi:hexosaminidase
MEWWLISHPLEEQIKQNPRMSDAAVRAEQLGQLGMLGLQSLAGLNPGNQALGGLAAKGTLIPADRRMAVIDSAQKPVALVRFTFLDSLKKLAGAAPAFTGPVGGTTTPPAQP